MTVKIEDIAKALGAEVLAGADGMGREIGVVIASDLVSDVLVSRDDRAFLLTGLANIQVVRAAEMIDLIGVCLCRGKTPGPDMLAYAREAALPLLVTKRTLYESCGLVYKLGVKSGVYNPPCKPGVAP